MAEGGVGFPLGNSCSGEAADTASSYGNLPAAMAEGKGVNRFSVLGHVHFEDFEDDLWPARKLAAHSTQGTFSCIIQIPMNFMHWSFNFPQGDSTETTETPS